ncbi:aliphatic sulfonate ABC transporter substrate-binding protein [Prauserella cavernicola]|uniref:Aliphatic sulfonate ABC transporter substrate-binding protein n=1 Tax=Prauserella cavernicola TaxID=2800127 RepID=A0A934QMN5_9PSEU|nr:aliphatic sulfonate ABC transporter substrate-binding protein [Prauserella cavernicola]MBK1783351.1 aliphatic sulfonate ABC transporter substrate-binding protein [Prauserella cavernicola]
MRGTRRAVLSVLSVIALGLSLTACSESGDDSEVRFGYIGDYNGASLLAIAEEQGLWDEAGLSAEPQVFTNGPLQIQALNSGDLDFGYIGPGAFWLPASGQSKIVAINTLTYADRVIAQPGIDSVADLKGKRVGVPEGTSGDMVLNLALQEAGLTVDDVEKVPMDPSTIVSAFVSGQIDAAGIWYPLIGTSIKPKVPDLRELASTRDFEGSSFPTAFVSGREVDDELTGKVISVLQKANDWRAENPEQAIDLSAGLLNVDRATVEADAANVETMTTQDLVAKTEDGTVDGWLTGLSDFFVGTGQLQQQADPADYYTGDLYTGAFRE